MILDKIDELLKEVSTLSAKNADDVEQLRLKYLSKKGEINGLMAEFRDVAKDQKKTIGIKLNELKKAATEKINQLREEVVTTDTGNENIDLTRTAYPVNLGTRHPLTIVKNEIIEIFQRMGFTLYHGPEIDDDKHVFTMLNFAADHPARDMQDTFFISQNPNDVTKNVLLRSHTSGDGLTTWKATSRLSASSARDASIVMRPSRPALTASSTRWKDCMWTRA